ncbi:beta-1,6-N-acetylglucosaminyltransferase [uncultured Brachyspira sp.]|uniref:beta-1,6-N-acetylglucosaminyltransferase n=1 Tax=uncultured Brachyspira sp. TaxID=221953 RepID=UPI0026214E62|nr:beta-1,6-N-acetylglucosaminyltransferase [uncultured Brachyspira sp.]
MSKICFLIAAHKNHDQLMRLINHLKKDFDIYVHIDKKSKLDIKSFDNVKVYKKYKIYHAEFSQVIGTLFLLNESSKNNYDRYIFISAQDIPLKTNKEIIDFFSKEENNDKEFINYREVIKNDTFYEVSKDRLCYYYPHFCIINYYHKLFHYKIRNILLKIWPKRKMIENLYNGSSWWNLSDNAVKYILEYVEKNTNYIKRFNYTWCSDEYFFQSILLNSKFASNCKDEYLRYVDWSWKYGANPVTFKLEDYDDIKSKCGNSLFARKFDENIDNDIIDKLYKDLENSN